MIFPMRTQGSVLFCCPSKQLIIKYLESAIQQELRRCYTEIEVHYLLKEESKEISIPPLKLDRSKLWGCLILSCSILFFLYFFFFCLGKVALDCTPVVNLNIIFSKKKK